MFSFSPDALLNLFKTTFPYKLFPSDCITLYAVDTLSDLCNPKADKEVYKYYRNLYF